MSTFITFTLPIYLFWLVVLAAMLALVAHLLFLRALAVHEPGLWQEYRRVAFTAEHWMVKRPKVRQQVYARISAPAVAAAHRREVLFWRIFAVVLLLVSLLFGAVRLLGDRL